MTDIAVLGLSVDSRQVVSAKQALDGLTAAAKPAAAAATALEKSTAGAGKGAAVLSAAVTPAIRATTDMAKAADTAAHAHQGMSTQAMSAFHSIRSMTEGLLLGMPPMQVFTGQLNHLSYAASGAGGISGAFKEVLGSFTRLVSPVTLLTGGLVGLAAGGVLVVHSLAESAKAFDDLARSIDTSRGSLNLLEQAASFKGIGSDDFAKGAKQFGAAIYDAKNNMGSLGEFLRANGKSATDFQGTLETVADLIKNAKNDQERILLLQRNGLPATMEWVKFLSQGKDGIRAATEEATRFNESAEGKLIASARAFDEAWNKATTKFVSGFKSGIIEIVGALSSVQVPQWLTNLGRGAATGFGIAGIGGAITGAIGGAAQGNAAQFGDRFGSFGGVGNASGLQQGLQNRANSINGTGSTVDPNVLQRQISLQQQQLGIYGQTITALEAVKQVELQVQQARLSGVTVDQKRVEVLKRLAVEQTIGVTAIKAQTDAAKVDAATVGMSVENATRYAAAQNALNDARRAGRELTPENIAQIQREAAALGAAAGQADLLRFSYTNLVQGPLQTFTSALQQGATAWDAFKKAGQSALNALASKLADMAAQNLWGAAFGGSTGNIFSSLFGGSGGGAQAASASTLANNTGGAFYGPGFASGTNSAPGGWSIVGEKGPEWMNVPKGAQILPNGVTPSGGGGGVQITVVQNNDFRNSDPGSEARIRVQLEQTKNTAVREAVAAVARIRSTNPTYLAGQR